jgi:hypothetical protein
MKYGALIGWGIGIYAVMFLVWSGFVTYGFVEGVLPRIVSLLTLITVSIVAGRALHLVNWKDVLPYSATWVVVVIIADVVLSVPFTGWALFSDWNVWVGYALVLLVPLLAPYTHAQKSRHAGD